MDADILQAIRIIDDKIASLQEARNRLASAFGIVEQVQIGSPAKITLKPRPLNGTQLTAPLQPQNPINTPTAPPPAPQPSERKAQVARFLLQNGPASRTTLVERCGIPEGTVSYCLNDKVYFKQSPTGDWDVTDNCRTVLRMFPEVGLAAKEHP